MSIHPIDTEEKKSIVPAPLITSAGDIAQRETLIDYIRMWKKAGHETAADYEATRLAPYFNRISGYLGAIIPKAPEQARDELGALASAHSLADLFRTMARASRCTLLSETVFMPIDPDLRTDMKYAAESPAFSFRYSYRHKKDAFYDFGFQKIRQSDGNGIVTIPFVGLDSRAMKTFPSDDLHRLMKPLATLFDRYCIHDALHHLTSMAIDANVSDKERTRNAAASKILNLWALNSFETDKDDDPRSYEPWANIFHARVMADAGRELKPLVNEYFDTLQDMRLAQMSSLTCDLDRLADAVEYFGMLMPYTLMRILPLNDPLMEHAIMRWEDCELYPEEIAEDFKSYISHWSGKPEKCPDAMGDIVKSYRLAGSPLIPADGKDPTGMQARKFAIAGMTPPLTKILCPVANAVEGLPRALQKNDSVTLNMLKALGQIQDKTCQPA